MDIGIMAISRNIHRSPTLGGAGTMTQMNKQEVLFGQIRSGRSISQSDVINTAIVCCSQ